MANHHHHIMGDFLKTLKYVQAMATFRQCPDCAKKGIVSPVVPRRVNEEIAIWKCNSSTCIYPMSQSVEFFKAQFVPVNSIDERLFCRYIHYNIVKSEYCSSDETGEFSVSPIPMEDTKTVQQEDDQQQNNHKNNSIDQTADSSAIKVESDGSSSAIKVESDGCSSAIKVEFDDENNGLSFLTDAFAAMDDDGDCKIVKSVNKNKSRNRKRGRVAVVKEEEDTQNDDGEGKTVKRSSSRSSPVSDVVVLKEKKKDEKKSAHQFLRQLMADKRAQPPLANQNSTATSAADSKNHQSAQGKRQQPSNSTMKFAKRLIVEGNTFHYGRNPVSDKFEPMVLTSLQKQTVKTEPVSLDDVKSFISKKKFPGYISRGYYDAASSSETKSECDSDSLKHSCNSATTPVAGAKSSGLSSGVKRTLVKSLKDALAHAQDKIMPVNGSTTTIQNDSVMTTTKNMLVTHSKPSAAAGQHQQNTVGAFYSTPSIATSQAQFFPSATQSFPIIDVQQPPAINTMYATDSSTLHVTAANEYDLNSDSAFFDYTSTSSNILDDSSMLFSVSDSNNILSDNGLEYCEL